MCVLGKITVRLYANMFFLAVLHDKGLVTSQHHVQIHASHQMGCEVPLGRSRTCVPLWIGGLLRGRQRRVHVRYVVVCPQCMPRTSCAVVVRCRVGPTCDD